MSKLNAPADDSSTPTGKPPKSWWDTVVTSTPVVMTVIATILAGLSSGEMGRAQYYRSIAAQTQSKVSDQWGYFQAKRLRASSAENALKMPLLMGGGGAARFDPATLGPEIGQVVARLAAAAKEADRAASAVPHADAPDERAKGATGLRDAVARAHRDAVAAQSEVEKAVAVEATGKGLALMAEGGLPKVEDKPVGDDAVREAMKAVESTTLDPGSAAALNKIKDADLAAAMRTSDQNAAAFDAAAKPLGKAVERVQQLLAKVGSAAAGAGRAADEFAWAADDAADLPAFAKPTANTARLARAAVAQSARLNAALAAAVLRYDAARYDRESAINLVTARLYEIQVRKATLNSERHLTRSYYFFYGMLGAQAAVTLASLALAVKERSVFWSIATTVGVAAIAYGGYVYVFK